MSNPNRTYISPEYFLQQLEKINTENMSVERKYQILRNVFYRSVEQRIADVEATFSGMFAKVDFLMKRYEVSKNVVAQIHETRRILFPQRNKRGSTDALANEHFLPYDLKATTLLVCVLYDVKDIPEALRSKFPKDDRASSWGKFDENVLRVIVDSWDENFIYATEEEKGMEVKVCYGTNNKYLTRDGIQDWSYLNKILKKDSQLNLVRIRMEGDVFMPELIIFEPDFLINITTIASCFETYAESPFVNLINKLRPSAQSAAIQLGNLAGQFLDQTVHKRETSFEEDIMDFFKHNAIQLVTCPDMNDKVKVEGFYTNAKLQKKNIENLIGEGLKGVIKDYDSSLAVLEPTFFSDVLGMQGRLDFLYEDNDETVIIEQKSGKGAYVSPRTAGFDPELPLAQEKHMVQLTLYRALFIYEFKKYASQLRHVFLLYSKYSKGLLATAHSPELLLRAIRIRNLLAWCEINYANEGAGMLSWLTPEKLNMKGASGRLWEEWTRPDIESVLVPIRNASSLERLYFLRFLRFIEMEQMLAKVGNKTKDCSGFASTWLDTLEDKKNAGTIYDSLSLSSLQKQDEIITGVELSFAEIQSADASNFRIGDIVILYPYRKGEEPDACGQMVTRCSIVDITAEHITLKLRFPQTSLKVFDDKENRLWAIEHDLFESSSGALYSGLHSFLSAIKERRDLILSQRRPTIDKTIEIKGEYGAFNSLVTHASQAKDMFLIIGPPGTGKTSYGMLNLVQEELMNEGNTVLLLSYTNRAVDEICSKLVESHIDFIRIGAELSCSPEYRNYLLSRRVKDCRKSNDVRQIISSARVMCGTTASLNSNISLFSIKHFDLAIIDEASQILEPHLIGLLSASNGYENAIKRFVLIGDHKQLPAVVQQTAEISKVDEPELQAINLNDCRLSLFERMLKSNRTEDGYNPDVVYMLTKQGRMHRDIADFPNIMFYEGKLDIVPLDHQHLPICTQKSEETWIDEFITSNRIGFVSVKDTEATGHDKTNLVEAELISQMVERIYYINKEKFDTYHTVGIIVPYRNQIATVRNAIDRTGIKELHDITIDTVERYQGSQRDYIIYGFTIKNPYQLNFLTDSVFEENGRLIDRKLNVAMTRARLHLFMVGNEELLRLNPTFSQLMDYVRDRGAFRTCSDTLQ